MKADAYVKESSPVAHVYHLLRYSLSQSIHPERLPVTVLCLLAIWLACTAKTRESRTILTGVALLAVLQVLIGRFNWFHRYEVYALAFLLLVTVGWTMRTTRIGYGYYVAGLSLFASTYMYATLVTVTVATKVYRQQYQMHRFVTECYTGNYAVNDLGLASFRRRPGSYVLDLFGLGSLESAEQADKSSAWLDQITMKHDADLAIIYRDWFGPLPASWTPLATMCEQPSGGIGGHLSRARPCVVYYSTRPEASERILRELRAFAPTLPRKVTMRLEEKADR